MAEAKHEREVADSPEGQALQKAIREAMHIRNFSSVTTSFGNSVSIPTIPIGRD
jgi:hypothetical protein